MPARVGVPEGTTRYDSIFKISGIVRASTGQVNADAALCGVGALGLSRTERGCRFGKYCNRHRNSAVQPLSPVTVTEKVSELLNAGAGV